MDFLEKVLRVQQTIPKLDKPKRFKVVLINDDYTPMDFVVEVLEKFFHCSQEKAIDIMLQVHKLGKGICGVFTKDIAETKATLVSDYARQHEHPLLCIIEPE